MFTNTGYILAYWQGGLGFAFAVGLLGNLPLVMLYHGLGNYLFQLVMLIQVCLGLG
jgi:hypothetical protein